MHTGCSREFVAAKFGGAVCATVTVGRASSWLQSKARRNQAAYYCARRMWSASCARLNSHRLPIFRPGISPRRAHRWMVTTVQRSIAAASSAVMTSSSGALGFCVITVIIRLGLLLLGEPRQGTVQYFAVL